jgi:hypothetical protein
MEERLKTKKLILRLLTILLVLIPIVASFIPFFKMTKVVETAGMRETITAEYSIFQLMTQDDTVKLTSSSALGQFEGFSTTTISNLLGGENIAFTATFASIILAVPVAFYALGLLLAAAINCVQQSTLKYFALSSVFFFAFSIFVTTAPGNSMEVTTGSFITAFIIIIVMYVVLMIQGELLESIEEISTEIFLSKYKNYDPKWFEAFTADLTDYLADANLLVGLGTLVRFGEACERVKKNDSGQPKL